MDFGTSKLVALVAQADNHERCDIVGAGTALQSRDQVLQFLTDTAR